MERDELEEEYNEIETGELEEEYNEKEVISIPSSKHFDVQEGKKGLRLSCDTGMRSALSGDSVLPPKGSRTINGDLYYCAALVYILNSPGLSVVC